MNCTKCNNTGWVDIEINGNLCVMPCSCVKQRQSLARLKRSGLSDLLNKFTFDRYNAEYGFQKDLLTKAKNYIKEKNKWFIVLGQSGSSKTHICTAICGELLKQGHEVRFMSWLTESVRLKQNVNNAEVYEPLIEDYKNCEILYIDDFFKNENLSSADLRIANEIINFRCVANKRTLISSERLVKDLMEIDEAIIGRMVEKAKEYLTEIVGKEKNYRLKDFI